MSLSRRALLARGTALAGGAALLGLPEWTRGASAATAPRLPKPAASGIDHIVVVMMENRSFDHFLGWLPGADGRQAGLAFTDGEGVEHSTYRLSQFQGCGHPDPDHSWEGGRTQYANGACDGWLRSGDNDEFAIGYYRPADLPFYAKAAPYWTVCDRYFAAIMAETYPNRMFLHAGQTDRLHNDEGPTIATLPTVWDRLAAAGRTGRYYYSDVPYTALWGTKYLPISRPVDDFFAACASGTLPDVSFVDPRFLDEGSGSSGDDHPHADIRVGQRFLASVYDAVTTGPEWSRTMLVITYDEWGGFFDHVPPPVANDPDPNTRLRGFRVPCIVVAPRAAAPSRRTRPLRPHVDPQARRLAFRAPAAHLARRPARATSPRSSTSAAHPTSPRLAGRCRPPFPRRVPMARRPTTRVGRRSPTAPSRRAGGCGEAPIRDRRRRSRAGGGARTGGPAGSRRGAALASPDGAPRLRRQPREQGLRRDVRAGLTRGCT